MSETNIVFIIPCLFLIAFSLLSLGFTIPAHWRRTNDLLHRLVIANEINGKHLSPKEFAEVVRNAEQEVRCRI